ncbi:MAG: hypothetical protein ACP5N3_02720 [Candidatus Nanoarchaeia archaeon]
MDSKKGYGITFVDMDETLFKTFAKVKVMKDGKLVKSLLNKEFNTYVLQEGESFDFSEFLDSKLFKETSIPIEKLISRIKKTIQRIKENKSFSRIIVLTARGDFWDKETFLDVFRAQGIDVSDKNIFYIHRLGNTHEKPIAEKKKDAVLKYLSAGIYRRCRMIDDEPENIRKFLELQNDLPEDIKQKIRKEYGLKETEAPIKFYALQVLEDGTLKAIK